MLSLRSLFRTSTYFLETLKPLIILGLLLMAGTSGYMAIEDYTILDAMYMTAISITTVGFGEVKELTDDGKVFTIILIFSGVVFYGFAINALLRVFLEKRFKDVMERARMVDKIKKLKNHFIICGGGRMAYSMAVELERHGKSFVIVENNTDSIVSKSKEKFLVLEQDALQEESLQAAGIDRAVGLAAVLPTDADNLFVVLSARRLNPGIRIETRIADLSARGKMLQAGADKVVFPYALGGLQMARSLLNPEIDDILGVVMDNVNYEFEMKIHLVTTEDEYSGKMIKDSNFRDKGYIVVGIRFHDGRMIYAPGPNFRLDPGVELLLLGSGAESVSG